MIPFSFSAHSQEPLISTSGDNPSEIKKQSAIDDGSTSFNGVSRLNQVRIIPKWQIKEDGRGRNRNGQKRKLEPSSGVGLDLYQKKILGLDSVTSGNATLDPRCKKRKRATLLTKDGPVDVSHMKIVIGFFC